MKPFILICLLLFIFSCNSKQENNTSGKDTTSSILTPWQDSLLSGLSDDEKLKKHHIWDSLNFILEQPNAHDTALASANVMLTELVLGGLAWDTCVVLCNKSISIADKALNKKPNGKIRQSLLNSKGLALNNKSTFTFALDGSAAEARNLYFQSIEQYQQTNNNYRLGETYRNLCELYADQINKPDSSLYYCDKSIEHLRLAGALNFAAYPSLQYLIDVKVKSLTDLMQFIEHNGVKQNAFEHLHWFAKTTKFPFDERLKALDYLYDRAKDSVEVEKLYHLNNWYGNQLKWEGRLDLALELYERNTRLSKTHDNVLPEYLNIGVCYYTIGDTLTAIEYYNKGLKFAKTLPLEDRRRNYWIAVGLLRIGSTKLNTEKERGIAMIDSAIIILKNCKSENREHGAIGYCYLIKAEQELQKRNYTKALTFAREIAYWNQIEPENRGYNEMIFTSAYFNLNMLDSAEHYAKIGYEKTSKKNNRTYNTDRTAHFCDILYKIQIHKKNYEKALALYIEKDTLLDIATNKRNSEATSAHKFEREREIAKTNQQIQLSKEKNKRNMLILFGILLMVISAGLITRLRFVRKSKIILQKEKNRSDELLLNILPAEVAEELKSKGAADAKQFDEVTVLFTDFKNFTQISENMSPTELVEELNTFFKAFDEIITQNNIEKIKTIGDSYMCVGGLPAASPSHAEDVVNAGLQIQQFVEDHSKARIAQGKEPLLIRIGIHSGPVIAGIVGVKKYAYDIWGDTVNTASRMESSSETGKVNISEATYLLVKDKFNCTPRGKIAAKNKGEMEMYFVDHSL